MSRARSASRSFPEGEIRSMEGLPVVNPHAAGADIGAQQIFVCIPGPNQTQIVRSFSSRAQRRCAPTADLQALADWLIENGIQTIAMESTGVYWIPLFELLEQRGIRCCLISGNLARRLPACHKTYVLDCQWIQTLHSLGLLTESFRPEADLIALRALLRHRAQLIEHRAPHILHMQKALTQMNLRLDQAVSDVTGQTGLSIIRAIVAGERDSHKLAALRNYRCQKDEEEIAKALTGTLQQAQGRPGGRSISSSSNNPWNSTTSTPARLRPVTPRLSASIPSSVPIGPTPIRTIKPPSPQQARLA